jgi:meso-butanediol dehydrogenase/(S,S)-butanediol dehydrogenase/diacetyl reductase
MASADRSQRLQGKAAIVTGAGQGVGRGVALALAAEGASVTLCGRTGAKLQLLADEITARGGASRVVAGDVTVSADRQRCVTDTLHRFGRIDILVNAAFSPEARQSTLLETSPQFMEQVWQSGFVAVVELMRSCHPHMKRGGGGSVINFGSSTQLDPKEFSVYGGIKCAVQVMSRGAAMEWAEDQIRVNVVLPIVASPAWEAFIATQPGLAKSSLNAIPQHRMGDPELDVGRPCAFLASDDARFITGATIPLDGGLSFVR